MKSQSVKVACSAVSAAALIAGGATALAPAVADASAMAQEQVVSETTQNDVQNTVVQGLFSFDQDAVTPNAAISGVFVKAASALCQSLPYYAAAFSGDTIAVSGPNGASFATVGEMTEDAGTDSYVMGCSCASNVPGGGAVVNAEVSGVSLASLAVMFGA